MANDYIKNMLGENERILLVTRQHGFVLFSSIIAEIVVALIVLVAISALMIANPVAAFGFLLILVPLVIMTRDILAWTNRQCIVTNRRVIQISGIFNKDVFDSSLEKVNDVKMVQSAMGRVFNFGDIEILTASEMGVNLFRQIANPVQFKTAMVNAKAQLEGYDRIGEEEESVPALIEQLDQLRKKGLLTEEEFQQKKTQLLEKL